jgi:hypothetical protein
MVEASHGRFRVALHSVNTATAMAAKTPDDSDYAIEATLMQAEVGLSPTQPITVAPSQTLRRRLLGTLALARTGRLEQATAAADALRRDFPSNTIVQKYGLPLIDGAVKLRSGDAAGAVALLNDCRVRLGLHLRVPASLSGVRSGIGVPAVR